MLKSDLQPPYDGPGSDPVLYGVAAGLAELFPPVTAYAPIPREAAEQDGDADEDLDERD